MELTLVIPAFNESARTGASLEAVRDHLESADGVPPERDLRGRRRRRRLHRRQGRPRAGGRHRRIRLPASERDRGKGRSLCIGVLASEGSRVLLCNADQAKPIEELARLDDLGRRRNPPEQFPQLVRHQPLDQIRHEPFHDRKRQRNNA